MTYNTWLVRGSEKIVIEAIHIPTLDYFRAIYTTSGIDSVIELPGDAKVISRGESSWTANIPNRDFDKFVMRLVLSEDWEEQEYQPSAGDVAKEALNKVILLSEQKIVNAWVDDYGDHKHTHAGYHVPTKSFDEAYSKISYTEHVWNGPVHKWHDHDQAVQTQKIVKEYSKEEKESLLKLLYTSKYSDTVFKISDITEV